MAEASGREPAVELVVERLGAQGDGIAAWRGETVFVPFAAPGDRVRVRLGARRGPGRETRMIELLAAGPHRAAPMCRHFGRCGGCALQHLDTDAYRRLKLASLTGALHKEGIDPAVVAPLRSVPPQRRRARLGLSRPKDARGATVVGFRERFSHALVDLRECAVLEPALLRLVDPLRDVARAALAPGDIAEAMLTRTDSGVDLLLEARRPPGLAALEALADLAAAHDLARIVWRAQGSDTPVVERRGVRVMLSGVAVPFPPGGFLQASAAAETILVAEIAAAIGASRPALDLYA
ncbi:MAG: class I SAM-dependent RNA methyltransferase, partial [Stellaceae bacterium]